MENGTVTLAASAGLSGDGAATLGGGGGGGGRGGGGESEGVQPESVACAEEVPSLTVILHVDELKPVRRIEKVPVDDAFPIATPSIVIVAADWAPCPSTRSSPLFSWARVNEMAAVAAWAATRTSTPPSSKKRMLRRIGSIVLRSRRRNGLRS